MRVVRKPKAEDNRTWMISGDPYAIQREERIMADSQTPERCVLEGVPRTHFYEGGKLCPKDISTPPYSGLGGRVPLPVQPDQTALHRDGHGFGPTLHVELGEDVADVRLDGVFGQTELQANRLVAAAGRQQFQHL
jgi:hypothetical protein